MCLDPNFQEKRKSARRKEFIMAELLETERSYVKDLELTLKNFLGPMREAGESLPAALRGKVIIVITILIILIIIINLGTWS